MRLAKRSGRLSWELKKCMTLQAPRKIRPDIVGDYKKLGERHICFCQTQRGNGPAGRTNEHTGIGRQPRHLRRPNPTNCGLYPLPPQSDAMIKATARPLITRKKQKCRVPVIQNNCPGNWYWRLNSHNPKPVRKCRARSMVLRLGHRTKNNKITRYRRADCFRTPSRCLGFPL